MYLLIENFNSGLDSRRMALTSRPGTLQELENAHITRGGEIEKRKSFQLTAVADNGTVGLHAANGALWTFGSEPNLAGDVLGMAPPEGDPNNLVPRINYMQLDSGGFSSRLTINPFMFPMSWKYDAGRNALMADIPPGGLMPTLPYQQLYIHFGTGGPPDGMYYTNVIRTDSSGAKKLLIYPGYLDVYPFENKGIVGSAEFVKFTGSVTWSLTNASAEKTTAPSCRLVSAYSYRGVYSEKDVVKNFTNIDGYYIEDPRNWPPKDPNQSAKPCTLLCHSKALTNADISVIPVGTSVNYSFYECIFVKGEQNYPTIESIFGLFSISGIDSLRWGTNMYPWSSFVDAIPSSTPVSFWPSATNLADGDAAVNWSDYSTLGKWKSFVCSKISEKINLGTPSHKMTATYGEGYVLITTDQSLYIGNPYAFGWNATTPFVSAANSNNYFSVFQTAPGFSAGTPIRKILSSDNYKGKIYVIAEFENGKVKHFYNGQPVTTWEDISNSGDATSVAADIASTLNKDGVYASTSSGNQVFVQFVKKNTNYSVSVRSTNGGVDNTQAISITTTPADSNSPQLTTITVTGFYEKYDIFTIIINGETYLIQAGASVVGKFCKTHSDKMYSTSGSLLYFSETSTYPNGGASAFTNNTLNGAGVINLSGQDSSGAELTSIALYQGKLAVFSENSVQIWTMNADPKLNTFNQILNNIGTSSPKSVVSLGNIDTYFLSPLGVRSLRARDASNVAIVSDVGNAIDDIIIADMRTLTQEQRSDAVGLIDPIDGRYWLCAGPKIYVYSYFPGSNINAWSVYKPTNSGGVPLEFDSICSLNQRIYARSGNEIYAYGGFDGNTYDSCTVKVTMPYLDGGKPGHFKSLLAIDSACVGEWSVYSGMDISAPESRDYIGKIKNSTYSMGRVSASGLGTHVGIQMTNSSDGYAKIGNFAVHFEINDAG